MKIDPIILNRFESLIEEGGQIEVYSGRMPLVNAKSYKKWYTSAKSCIQSVWGRDSDYYNDMYYDENHTAGCRDVALGVLEAAYSDYKNGYRWTYRIALGSELTSDTIEQGEELLKGKYKDSACVCARVALELALKELCLKNAIPISKLPAAS